MKMIARKRITVFAERAGDQLCGIERRNGPLIRERILTEKDGGKEKKNGDIFH